jgi:hypothetical protein
MVLKYSAQTQVTRESVEDAAPYIVRELMLQLLREAKPDWASVVIEVEPETLFDSWLFRIRCTGGTRDCIAGGN